MRPSITPISSACLSLYSLSCSISSLILKGTLTRTREERGEEGSVMEDAGRLLPCGLELAAISLDASEACACDRAGTVSTGGARSTNLLMYFRLYVPYPRVISYTSHSLGNLGVHGNGSAWNRGVQKSTSPMRINAAN